MPARVSPGATVYRAVLPVPGKVRTVPAWMVLGSGPMACRLAAYRACQPPGTWSAAAMPDKVSPGRTVHVPACRAGSAVTPAFAAVTDSLARTAWVLLAMLMFAWAAGWSGPRVLAAATRASRHQASTTHADMVHLRTMVLTSFLGISARTPVVRRREWAWRKEAS